MSGKAIVQNGQNATVRLLLFTVSFVVSPAWESPLSHFQQRCTSKAYWGLAFSGWCHLSQMAGRSIQRK